MASIESLSANPNLTESARNLFRAYAAFLRSITACHAFNFTRFDDEILNLPSPYTDANGDLLLALDDTRTATGCIAYRAAPADPRTCEIKRLFVPPPYRGRGIAEQIVRSALNLAHQRGYTSAILDTEPSTMQAAQQLYRKLGFLPYTPTHPHNPVDVTYLRIDLPLTWRSLTP